MVKTYTVIKGMLMVEFITLLEIVIPVEQAFKITW